MSLFDRLNQEFPDIASFARALSDGIREEIASVLGSGTTIRPPTNTSPLPTGSGESVVPGVSPQTPASSVDTPPVSSEPDVKTITYVFDPDVSDNGYGPIREVVYNGVRMQMLNAFSIAWGKPGTVNIKGIDYVPLEFTSEFTTVVRRTVVGTNEYVNENRRTILPTSGNTPITLIFPEAVSKFSVEVVGPTWEGNKIIAYDSSGNVVSSIDVKGNSNSEITNRVPVTITGNISKIELVPPTTPPDYVSFNRPSWEV